MERVKLHVAESVPVGLHVPSEQGIGLKVCGEMIGNVPTYDGPHEFEPSATAQTIVIDGMRSIGNIVIDPIPQNYGLITWDGSVLRVF